MFSRGGILPRLKHRLTLHNVVFVVLLVLAIYLWSHRLATRRESKEPRTRRISRAPSTTSQPVRGSSPPSPSPSPSPTPKSTTRPREQDSDDAATAVPVSRVRVNFQQQCPRAQGKESFTAAIFGDGLAIGSTVAGQSRAQVLNAFTTHLDDMLTSYSVGRTADVATAFRLSAQGFPFYRIFQLEDQLATSSIFKSYKNTVALDWVWVTVGTAEAMDFATFFPGGKPIKPEDVEDHLAKSVQDAVDGARRLCSVITTFGVSAPILFVLPLKFGFTEEDVKDKKQQQQRRERAANLDMHMSAEEFVARIKQKQSPTMPPHHEHRRLCTRQNVTKAERFRSAFAAAMKREFLGATQPSDAPCCSVLDVNDLMFTPDAPARSLPARVDPVAHSLVLQRRQSFSELDIKWDFYADCMHLTAKGAEYFAYDLVAATSKVLPGLKTSTIDEGTYMLAEHLQAREAVKKSLKY